MRCVVKLQQMLAMRVRKSAWKRWMGALCLVGLSVLGCRPFEAHTPSGFVELDEDSEKYDYRATTADGVVIAIRALDHEPKGELAFWVAAIERQLREWNGYALLETRDVKTNQGLTGKQLRFGRDEGSVAHLYYVTLFVTKKKLFVIEAGGRKDLMEREAAALDQAVAQFRH